MREDSVASSQMSKGMCITECIGRRCIGRVVKTGKGVQVTGCPREQVTAGKMRVIM